MLTLIYIALIGVSVEQGSVIYLTSQLKQPSEVIYNYTTKHKEIVISNGRQLIQLIAKDK